MKLWLSTYLREPVFDNPESKMPNPGVTPAHAKIIADYLIDSTNPAQTGDVADGPLDRLRFVIARFVPEIRYRHVIGAFGSGGIIGLVLTAGLLLLIRRKRPL